METTETLSTEMKQEVLARLREYAQASGHSISAIVSEAVAQYLDAIEVRPIFRGAAEDVIRENAELLDELAK